MPLHLLTFDYTFDAATRRAVTKVAAMMAVNSAPYIAALAVKGPALIPWLAPAAASAAAQLALTAAGKARTIPGVVAGTAMLSSTSIAWSGILGAPPTDPVLYTLYTVATALYVETRLAFRRVNPLTPLIPWTPAIIYAAYTSPIHLIATAEPTAKLLINAARNTKIREVEKIKRMGKAEAARSLVFTALILAAPG